MLFISQIHTKLFFVTTSDLSVLHVHLNYKAVTLSETRQIPHGSRLLALKQYSHSNTETKKHYYNQPIFLETYMVFYQDHSPFMQAISQRGKNNWYYYYLPRTYMMLFSHTNPYSVYFFAVNIQIISRNKRLEKLRRIQKYQILEALVNNSSYKQEAHLRYFGRGLQYTAISKCI